MPNDPPSSCQVLFAPTFRLQISSSRSWVQDSTRSALPSGGGGCAAHRPPHQMGRKKIPSTCQLVFTAAFKAAVRTPTGSEACHSHHHLPIHGIIQRLVHIFCSRRTNEMLLTMRLRVQAKVLESSSRHSQVHEHSKTKARRLQN